MKKEKAAPEKGKLLLRTYLMSLLSLMLCVTMLLGTTFAWFTSEVKTGDNQIYVGTLKVDLLKKNDAGQYVSLSAEGAPALFGSGSFKWEPGATMMETVYVQNLGDLSFHYSVGLTAPADAQNLDLIGKYIEVYTLEGENTATSAADFTAEGTAWTYAGTLNEVIKGAASLCKGSYDVTGVQTASEEGSVPYVQTLTIALHMAEETSDISIMGMSITNVGVKLVATQKNYESDAFGTEYDEGLTAGFVNVSTAEELQAALEDGFDVALINDIDLSGFDWESVASYSGTLLGNGHTISNLTNDGGLFTALDGATIRDLTIANAAITSTTNKTGILADTISKDANAITTTISNVTVSGTVSGGQYYTGGLIGSVSSYHAVISNCTNYATVNGAQQVGGILGYAKRDTEISNCTNYGTVTGEFFVGGILGFAACEDDDPTLCVSIENCMNAAVVTASTTGGYAGSAGGVVGNVGREGGNSPTNECVTYIKNCVILEGQNVVGMTVNMATGGNEKIKVETSGTAYAAVVSDNEGLAAAVSGTCTIVCLKNGNYELKGNQEDGLTIIGLGDAVKVSNLTNFAGNGNLGAVWRNVNFENVIFTEKIYTMDGGAQSSFKNCTFEQGVRGAYSRGVVFDGCTFYDNSEGFAMHFEKVYTTVTCTNCKFVEGTVAFGDNGDGLVTFNSCTFSGVTTRTEYFDAWASCELNDCTFEKATEIWHEHWENGETVTLNNTTGATVVQK